jgi:hypothetical protein
VTLPWTLESDWMGVFENVPHDSVTLVGHYSKSSLYSKTVLTIKAKCQK